MTLKITQGHQHA